MSENIKQNLLELMGDFLDQKDTILDQVLNGQADPVGRADSELHIRMAAAAYDEYSKSIEPIKA